jgi:hypothetical protein
VGEAAPAERLTPERIAIEDDEGERQGHGHGLGQERGGESRERRHAPPAPEPAPSLDAADVGEDREHVEQGAQHVASLGDPRDRLDAQRMDREDQGGQRRAERDRPAPQVLDSSLFAAGGDGRVRGRKRRREQPPGHEEEHARPHGVHEHVDQVIPERVHPAERVVESQRQPGQRDPVPQEGRREHPPKVGPAQAAKVRVVGEVHVVVPVHEARLERGEERDEGGGDEEEKEQGTRQGRH